MLSNYLSRFGSSRFSCFLHLSFTSIAALIIILFILTFATKVYSDQVSLDKVTDNNFHKTKHLTKHIETPPSKAPERERFQKMALKMELSKNGIKAPTTPSYLNAWSQNFFSIMAEWGDAADTESDISYYAWAIGTGTGSYSEMGNVMWWQSTGLRRRDSAYLTLNPDTIYYVSVKATNTDGVGGDIISSGPIQPSWKDLGQSANEITFVLSDIGLDANGNVIEGWNSEQRMRLSEFIGKMYPVIKELYGPPATNYTVTFIRDLWYSSSAIFIPSSDEIHMNDDLSYQLTTHEMIHAFRNDYTLSSNSGWKFDTTLSPFEEGFAQGVSYECMNRYIELYPDDGIVVSSNIWLSDYDWDYDFQNVDELRGTDLWSDMGGTSLHWRKYEMAAAAIRKINIESSGFYKAFNREYYRLLNADHDLRPSRELVIDIIGSVTPAIEGRSASEWIDKQHVFYCQNVYGKKIWHKIQDYPSSEFWVFQYLFYFETMSCGSEWGCWNSDLGEYVYHSLNGKSGDGALYDWNNKKVWGDSLLIEPTINPGDPGGYWGFGSDEISLTTASTQEPWPGGEDKDFIFNLDELGLYRFEATFEDTTNSIYRVLGDEIDSSFKGVFGGIIDFKDGLIYFDHEDFEQEGPFTVSNRAFYADTNWTGVFDPINGYYNSIPGKVTITFVDADTGAFYKTQRNIDYGSWNGNQMFLLDFTDIDSAISISPISYNYGTVNTGSNSTPQTFTITNVGGSDLMMETFQLTGVDASEFSIQNDNCSGRILSPTENCEVDVTFSPALAGLKSANLLITLDDIDTTTLETQLNGKGLSSVPTPDIKVNGSDGPVTPTDNLSVTVELNPGSRSGDNADWWLAADTPIGWFYLVASTMSWEFAGESHTDLLVTHQGALFNLATVEVFNIPVAGLPPGTYTLYFDVDMNMNGLLDLDELFFDSVVVNINP